MAENNENSTTEQIADAIIQTDNPFAQHEEPIIQEFVTESIFSDAPVETLEQVEGNSNQNTPPATVAPVDESDDEGDPVEYLNEIWREQGVKINSLDDIPAIIKEYQKLVQNKPADLSAEEQARIKLARETGNWGLYDQIVSVNTQSIDNRDAMKAKFLFENPTMAKPFAEKLFEKNLSKMFSEEDSEEFIAQYLEHEGAIAKKWLEEKKTSINIAEDSNVEKVQQDDSYWFKGVDAVIDQLAQDKNQITYELEDKAVNVVIDQDELLELRDAMDNPQGWIRDNILNEQGGWDFEKLAQLILKDMHINKISKEYYELGRVHQEQHLLSKQRGVTTQTPSTGAPKNNTDPRDNVANVFQKFRTGF